MFKAIFLFLSVLAFSPISAVSEDATSQEPTGMLRIGGNYRISKIEKIGKGEFKVRFDAEKSTGRYDILILKCDHVHVGMREGEVLRLSAEVVLDRGKELDVTQALLFLPDQRYGTTPVWLLSSKFPAREIRGARYLDMHAPQSDFEIL